MTRNAIIWMLGVFLHMISPVLSDIYCTGTYCSGWAYCCGINDDMCCYYFVYQIWWFWLIWVFLLLMLVSCCWYCVRRRRVHTGYYLVPGHTEHVYGTVTTTTTTTGTAPPAYPATQYQTPPSYPVNPPQYQPAEKPPGYVP